MFNVEPKRGRVFKCKRLAQADHKVDPAWYQHLKLKSDELISIVAVDFDLRPSTQAFPKGGGVTCRQGGSGG